MATFYHQNSEIQAPDGLQTLVLMNPSYVQYSSDAPPPPGTTPSNLVFLNSPPHNLTHVQPAQPQTQQFVGQNSHGGHIPHEISPLHGFIPRVQYNLWSTAMDPSGRETPRSSQQGLSLSLSSQNPGGFRSFRSDPQPPPQAPAASGGGGSPSSASGVTNGVSGIQGVLLSSKYLKAAQELLEEVVNVGSGIKGDDSPLKKSGKQSNNNGLNKAIGEPSSSTPAQVKEDGSPGTGGKSGAELSTAERQEIQMKKAKLINMLDEVEQRYRQYHHQMQIVISSFEQAAGIGSAKTYTALALQTISKQFRCLKDAIASQIRTANKSLGEEDSPAGKIEGSRLKFVDHHLRQQRALQQLGMIQHNAWRPQRGLPERSVSILRAWLFEHFLHPYPKDSDKHMLAKQTGLTRSQVSNWFINARVRLWKPMVEEMYVEEVKEHEQNGTDIKTSKSIDDNEDSASKSSSQQDKGQSSDIHSNKNFKLSKDTNSAHRDAPDISTNSTSLAAGNVRNAPPGFSLIGTSELDGITQVSPKKPRNTDMLQSPTATTTNVPAMDHDQLSIKFGEERQTREGYSIMGGPANFIGGFGQYPIGEIGRFGAEQFNPFGGNSVSLTLGLPHTENLSLSIDHQAFLPSQNIHLGRRVEVGEGAEFVALNAPIPPHSSTTYEGINIQNRKRFAAQLLPDFVA